MPTRPAPPTRRPARRGVRRRARPLACAALTLVAALALTACHDGQGLRDEGPSGAGVPTGAAAGAAAVSATEQPAGTRQPDPVGWRSFRAASVAQ
ncbi:hypothetical protein [Streptomyces sp. NPDC058291]|jgi:hypothetical protein|uniref:hypothetical protein n=1 Tax=Streptomyces sp. NPDC058291 TaxID=3346427 RepID=UPI0036F1464D